MIEALICAALTWLIFGVGMAIFVRSFHWVPIILWPVVFVAIVNKNLK